MQIPPNGGDASPQPYYSQPGEPRSSSPYYPPSVSPYQQQSHPPDRSYQPPYGQPIYSHYAAPPQRTYASYDAAHAPPPEGYGYEGQYPSQYPSHHAPPRPSHSPYQPQGGYNLPPGPPPPGQYGSAASYMTSGGPAPPPASRPGEDDRGVLGALAGGAAGAWAGHKASHGFLGALGGALAGHKLQDAVSEHKKKQKKHEGDGDDDDDEKKHPRPPPPPPKAQQAGGHHNDDDDRRHHHHHAGNFSASSTQMTLDGDYDLIASCRRVDGAQRLSAISLNDCLANGDGRLRWARGGNFGASARGVRLVDGGRTLEAELRDCRGAWAWDRIALDERIGNQDGDLVLV